MPPERRSASSNLSLQHKNNRPGRNKAEVCGADTTDWNDRGKAEEWRKLWADYVNRSLAERGIHEKLDHRSYKRQGIEKIPSVHMGAAASQMERRGISNVRGMEKGVL